MDTPAPELPVADFRRLPLSGWFPGHMLKAGRDLEERIRLIDLVVELLDARVPGTSRNPLFARICGVKPRFLLFTKADLADPAASAAWQTCFREAGETVLFLDARDGNAVNRLPAQWQQTVARARLARGATRPLNRPVRILIAGIPNVGKSTLVNRLAASHRTAVGPKPGVTRTVQWVRLRDDVEVLDTPGVLWPRLRDKEQELELAVTGAIRDEVVGEELLAAFLWYRLLRNGRPVAWDLYDLAAAPATPAALLEAVGRRRGLLRTGGTVDAFQSAVALLKDYREGRLGRFTWDAVPAPPPATATEAADA